MTMQGGDGSWVGGGGPPNPMIAALQVLADPVKLSATIAEYTAAYDKAVKAAKIFGQIDELEGMIARARSDRDEASAALVSARDEAKKIIAKATADAEELTATTDAKCRRLLDSAADARAQAKAEADAMTADASALRNQARDAANAAASQVLQAQKTLTQAREKMAEADDREAAAVAAENKFRDMLAAVKKLAQG